MTIAELTARISVVGESAVKQSLSRVEASARKMGEAIRTAADATRLLSSAFAVVGKVSGIEAAMAYDAQVRGLAAYQKNAQSLEAQLKRLVELAKLPGLGLPEVTQGVLSLEAAGLSAQLAERSIKAFGNALALAGGSKDKLNDALLQLSQIASAGKLAGDELNVMAQQIPQIRQAIKAAFGTTSTEQINKLGYSVDKIISMIIDQLEKLPAATTGFRVSFENLGDAINAMVRPIGTGLLDMFQGTSDSGTRLIDTMTRLTTSIGEVFSAIGRSGVLEDVLAKMTGSTMQFGKGWQNAFVLMTANFLAFVSNIRPVWDAFAKDMSGVWDTFTANVGISFRNMGRGLLMTMTQIARDIAKTLGFGAAVAKVEAVLAPEKRMSYTSNFQKALVDLGLDAFNIEQRILGVLGPQGLPGGLIFGGGAKQGAAAAMASEAEKKSKKTQETLQRIESNTRRSADALDLRNQTLGGGRLGQLGITGSELAGMGMRTQNDLSRAKPISADTMVTRGIKQMIQNNLGFAVNGGRAIPTR